MSLKKLIAAFVALALPASAMAWTQDVSIDYRMGDNESRTMAERNATEKLKVQAAAEVQTYISREQTLEDGEISESVRAIGASLVRLDEVEKSLALDESQNMILSVDAQAHVDDSALKERIKAIQEDKSKQRALERLARENEKLRQRLEKASGSSGNEQLSDQLRSQSEIYDELEKNSDSVEQVFARGTLVSLAEQSSDRLSKIKADIRENVFGAFTDATVSASMGKVSKDSDGFYTVRLDLDSELDWHRIKSTLTKHFGEPYEHTPDDTLQFRLPEESEGADPANIKAFNWLMEQEIQLRIGIDTTSFHFSMLNAGEDECGGVIKPGHGAFEDPDQYDRVCLYDPAARNNAYPVNRTRLVEPISVSVPSSIAERATTIETQYVVEQ